MAHLTSRATARVRTPLIGNTSSANPVSRKLAGRVAFVLEDIPGGMVAEVVPLELVRLVGRQASSVNKFVAARHLSDRPVIVVDTKTDFYERFESIQYQ